MKIGCVFARRTNWPKWDWIVKAISNLGHETISVHHADELMKADAVCDAMLFEHRDCGIGWRHVRDRAPDRKAVWAQWWFDLVATDPRKPLDEQPQFQLCGNAMRLFDAVFVKERAMLDEYSLLGVKAHYMDQGCPSWWPCVRHSDAPKWDVMVFGNADPGYRERHQAVRQLVADGFSVAWAMQTGSIPKGVERIPWHHPEKLPDLMSQAKCTLCIDYRSDVAGYYSDRNWLVTGAGAVPLMRGFLGKSDIRDCAGAICSMTAEERQALGLGLRLRTMGANTYEHRVQSIISTLQEYDSDGTQAMPDLQGKEASCCRQAREDDVCPLPCV